MLGLLDASMLLLFCRAAAGACPQLAKAGSSGRVIINVSVPAGRRGVVGEETTRGTVGKGRFTGTG